ncbi:MAG: DUF2378 family protein [Archangium sp.]
MNAEPVVFAAAFDGIVRAFSARLTPELHAKTRALGVDLEHRQVAYPVDVFLPVFLLLAEALVPGDEASRPDRLRRFGREVTRAFAQTAIGAATFTMARVVGVRRALQRAGRNIRTTGNYLEAEGVVVDTTEVHLVTRVMPEFHRFVKPDWSVTELYRVGIIEGFLAELGVRDARVDIHSREPGGLGIVYRITWRD